MLKYVLSMLFFFAVSFILFDHAMRVDQYHLCKSGIDLPCPSGYWIWSSN